MSTEKLKIKRKKESKKEMNEKDVCNLSDAFGKFSIEESLKFADLCCGIGGFHNALTNIGMTCVFACDIDKQCRVNYEENYKIKPEGDLTQIEVGKIPQFDVLCAGFPCQPFSKAGEQKGFDDDRGNIFFDICKIVKHHNPKYIILENSSSFGTRRI